MSFIYPRVVQINRPLSQEQAGFTGQYLAELDTQEAVIAIGLAASIQEEGTSGKAESALPASSRRTYYTVFIPAYAAALGLIDKNDIVIDDIGIRYQVDSNYWNSLGYKLTVYQLDA